MQLNDFMYDSLPYAYTIAGATALVLSHELVGRISGVLLITAALAVFRIRLEHRTRRALHAEHHLRKAKKALGTAMISNRN